MTITPTDEQAKAIDAIYGWYTGLRQLPGEFLLDGGAGTGKTTVASLLVDKLSNNWYSLPSPLAGITTTVTTHPTWSSHLNFSPLFAAYTGKAARAMQHRGMKDASTIHRLIYTPRTTPDGGIRWLLYTDPGNPLWDADLLVIDECSMVSESIATDLRSFNVPILVLGDVEGQLPPIQGTGAFQKRAPDFQLVEPHRSVLNSPIDRLAWMVRKGAKIQPHMQDGESVIIKSMLDPAAWDHITGSDQIVICGKHKTRYTITRRCRQRLGYSGDTPMPGEPIICCRNDYDLGLVNGDLAVVWRIVKNVPHLPVFEADLIVNGEDRPGVNINRELFKAHFAGVAIERSAQDYRAPGARFDWAYAITAHKAQGSEWESVCIVDDQYAVWNADERRRWLYTAITRASQRLVILQTGK